MGTLAATRKRELARQDTVAAFNAAVDELAVLLVDSLNNLFHGDAMMVDYQPSITSILYEIMAVCIQGSFETGCGIRDGVERVESRLLQGFDRDALGEADLLLLVAVERKLASLKFWRPPAGSVVVFDPQSGSLRVSG